MSSSYGENLHLTIFGQSHSPAIGVTMEGIPAGENVDPEALQRFLGRLVHPPEGGGCTRIPVRSEGRPHLRRSHNGHHPQH